MSQSAQWTAHLNSYGDEQPPHGPFATREDAENDIRAMRGLFQMALGAEVVEEAETKGDVRLYVRSPEGEEFTV